MKLVHILLVLLLCSIGLNVWNTFFKKDNLDYYIEKEEERHKKEIKEIHQIINKAKDEEEIKRIEKRVMDQLENTNSYSKRQHDSIRERAKRFIEEYQSRHNNK